MILNYGASNSSSNSNNASNSNGNKYCRTRQRVAAKLLPCTSHFHPNNTVIVNTGYTIGGGAAISRPA